MLLLFHGPDEFSAHEELAALRASGGFDFNQQTFYGEDSDPAEIVALCDTLPFLTERRLVVVEGLPKPKRSAKEGKEGTEGKGADDGAERDAAPSANESAASMEEAPTAKSKGRGKTKKGKAAAGGRGDLQAFVRALADYAPHVPETTTLVILVSSTLAATSPLLKAAQQHGTVKTFTPPTGAALESWVTRHARANDARIAPDAARELIERVGNSDLRVMASEIAKLSVYVGKGGEIRKNDVEKLIPPSQETPDFALTDALVRRDRARALNMLHRLLEHDIAPQQIIGMIAYQTRTLLLVKSLAERRMGVGQIASAAGMAPFVVEKALTLARQFSFAQLEAAHRSLLEADLALKRSKMTADMALDLLVVSFGAA